MPQLAPIMWISLFIFLWTSFVVWIVLNWFMKKKSFSSQTSILKNINSSSWQW